MKRNFGLSYGGNDGYGEEPGPRMLPFSPLYVVFAMVIFVIWVGSRYL